MDNLCHTLAGTAISYAGFQRKTRHATVTLTVAANLPDIDVLVFLTDVPSVGFRRGWTHGILADLLLPALLVGVVVALTRKDVDRVRAPWLLAAAYVGVLSHVFLDFLNNYGVRLLAPFDWRWFYGDAVFIVDPWLWLSLGAGTWLSRRWRSARPARVALVCASVYVLVMLMSAQAARADVIARWRETRGATPRSVMVGPLPVTPFSRAVIVDAGDRYESGQYAWPGGPLSWVEGAVPRTTGDPAIARAQDRELVRAYLDWARFPFWQTRPEGGGTRVDLRDMRFRDALGGRLAVSVVVQPIQNSKR